MPVIDTNSQAYNENSQTFWQNELQNARILLFEVNKGIKSILSGGHSSYDINTGQSSQSVRRLSLMELQNLRTELVNQIDELEKMLGVKSSSIILRPGF